MENKIGSSLSKALVGHANPKYMPQGRYTMRFSGITNNRVKNAQGIIHSAARVHFFIDTPWHGRRKFFKQYHSSEMGHLAHDLQHYLDELYPKNTRSKKEQFTRINRLKGKYADVRLATVGICPRHGIISGVSEFHGYEYFRYQEFITSQQESAHGTLAH